MLKNSVDNKVKKGIFFCLFSLQVVCWPASAAYEAGVAGLLKAGLGVVHAAKTVGTIVNGLNGAPNVGLSENIDPLRDASKRSMFDTVARKWQETMDSDVYWAKMGVDVHLLGRQKNIKKYCKEHSAFLERMRESYMRGTGFSKNHPQDGDQRRKYKKIVDGVIDCEEMIETAFQCFLDIPGKSSAKEAAFFLRASQLLAENNRGVIAPMTEQSLKSGRKKIRDNLRSFLMKSAKDELADLGELGYDHRFLCDSDDEGDEKEHGERLLELMKSDEAQERPDVTTIRQLSTESKSSKRSRNLSYVSDCENSDYRGRSSVEKDRRERDVSCVSQNSEVPEGAARIVRGGSEFSQLNDEESKAERDNADIEEANEDSSDDGIGS